MNRFVWTVILAVLFNQFLVFPARGYIDATLQMQLGNPSGAISDTNNQDHYLIQRSIEALDYDDNRGEPNWASWDLTAGDANGAVSRQDAFAADTNLPANFYRVPATAYAYSGYDRGHLCPSADRTDSTNDNDMTFLMSNMMPQAPDNNSGVWGNFENYCRTLAQAPNNDELLIICGPSGFNGAHINTNGYVLIPQYTWKIVVVVPPGPSNALARITATNRVIAIKVPNTNGVSSVWQNFITSASQIEVDTGFTFFSALPAEVASVLRNEVDGQTNPPPVIYGFAPTIGSTDTNVVITGTNFGNAFAVAINGASAEFTVNSSTQITAVVPTNDSSGLISVTTPSGTAISSSSFTVLNNGGTVYNGVLAGWDMSGLTGGANNYGSSPLAPTTNAPNISVAGLTRGSGVKQSGTAAARGWGGTGFTNVSAQAAIDGNQFATFGISASNGYQVSFTAVSRFDYYRSTTGPASGVLQYQVGANAFVTVTNLSYATANSGASIGAIDLTGFADLQNVGANTNVTFRIVNYGGTSSVGTWYVFDTLNSPAPDLEVDGIVRQIFAPGVPALAPVISLAGFVNQQFQFTVSGTTGSNYVVQATAGLNPPVWISLITNAAPFMFIESNVNTQPQRFYRSLVQP